MILLRVVLRNLVVSGVFLCQIHFQTAAGQVRPRVGGGGGGSGGGGGAPGPSSVALTTSSGKVALGAPLTITATVTGSNPTGTVIFYDYGNAITGPFEVVAGQAQIGTNALNIIGIHQITATYSGDAHNLGSTSTALSQVLTGTVPITIQGTTGSDIHSIQATVGVQ